MALVVGTDSYIDVAYADAYFESRYNSSFWTALNTATKETLLKSATRAEDVYCDWSGDKTDDEQDLEHPRNGDTEVSEKIKIAECEIAFSIHSNNSVIDEKEAPLTKLKADVVELHFAELASTTSTLYNSYTQDLLKGFCGASGTKLLTRV